MKVPAFIISLIIVLGTLYACKIKAVEVPETVIIEENPKIIFLTYHISQAPSGDRNMQLISQKVVDGQLKRYNSQSVKNASEGDLICLQFDEQSNIISRSLIKNPLIKHIESLNASKSFETKTIVQSATTFTERIALKPNTKSIIINNFADHKPLITTMINLE